LFGHPHRPHRRPRHGPWLAGGHGQPAAPLTADPRRWRRRRERASVSPRCDREVRCKTGAAPATVSGEPAATATGLLHRG
jgi:hypothetical protein